MASSMFDMPSGIQRRRTTRNPRVKSMKASPNGEGDKPAVATHVQPTCGPERARPHVLPKISTKMLSVACADKTMAWMALDCNAPYNNIWPTTCVNGSK